jgi:hypothetical protein
MYDVMKFEFEGVPKLEFEIQVHVLQCPGRKNQREINGDAVQMN